MPDTPYPINGTIKNDNGIVIPNARITLTITSGSVSGSTNSDGAYLLDLANAGTYSDGDTITYSVTEPNNNEVASGTTTVSDGGQTLNVSTDLRTDQINPKGVSDIQIHKIGGKIVTEDNPFPIELITQDGKLVQYDKTTRVTSIIEYEHHEIHAGSHYYLEGTATLGVDGTLYVKLVTPNTTKWAHFGWRIISSGILTTTLNEAPTGGMTGGNVVTPRNNNRNSSNVSGMTITSGVTACTGGTTISTEAFGSKQGGGSISRADELILKQNTTYCRTFLSGTASNIISFKASWYEHTDKSK